MATQHTLCTASRRCLFVFCLAIIHVNGLILASANGALIDFETTPAAITPIDDTPLPNTTPYVFPGLQIAFGLDANSDGIVDSNTVFEHTGPDPFEPPNRGFAGSSGGDTPDPGFGPQLGRWFLRSPVGGSDFGLLVITYTGTTVVTAASGEIWDIDGTALTPGGPGNTEEYTVRAYNSLNNLLATQVSPLGTLTSAIAPLDGQPWTFSFSGLSAGVAKITVDFTGSKPNGIGLAFNNFNPTQAAVPEPSGIFLAAIGVAALSTRRHRRINRTGCA